MSEVAGPQPVVVLCRPQMGENIGAAARAMLNFGLTELRLVRPACGWPNAKAVLSASGANVVLNGVRVFGDAGEALADLHHTFATTARNRELKKDVLTPEAAAREIRRLVGSGRRVGLMFGPERTGLTNEELLLADAIVSVPVNPDYASLNLGQAVLLCAYEWFRTGLGEGVASARVEVDPDDGREPATKAEVAGAVEHLVRELDAVDFFRSENRRGSLVDAISVMLERRRMTRPEVHLLRGIVKDLAGGRRARAKPGAVPAMAPSSAGERGEGTS